MGITGISSQTSIMVQSLLDQRSQLDDLQTQLGTGQKSTTYAGVGLQRGLAVGLRQQLSSMSSFDDSINNVNVRVQLAQTTLGRISDIGSQIKTTALQENSIDSTGSTIAQSSSYSELGELLGLLNTQSGDRYLFSGSATDQPSVDTLDHILNGNGAQAGLKQVMAERKQADLGANGLGRLVLASPTSTSVSVAEDAASPFGFKLAGISSSLTGATVTTPTGSPATESVDLGATNPNDGDTVQFSFKLPDGTNENITLTATTSTSPGANQFTIGANSAATATNMKAALTTAIGQLAGTSLTAASAVVASDNFFNVDATHTPQRVAGPPFATATSLVAGTSANTVVWYTGENGAGSARSTATAQVDPSISVSYGMRANEQGLRWTVQNVATLAAMTFSPSDPNSTALANALDQRVGANLDVPPGNQKVEDIEAELAGAQQTMQAATDRHTQTKSVLTDMVQQIEGVSNDQVAAEIMALQTRLQASLQTTSLLYKTSLVNYLPT